MTGSVRSNALRDVLIAATWIGASFFASAEVSVDLVPNAVHIIVLGTGTEHPDPILNAWQPYRAIEPARVLNPSGAGRGDGRPDITYRPVSGGTAPDRFPVVTWAWVVGTDRDIAVAEWEGTAWGPTTFVTSGTDDEQDPRIFANTDGTLHLVWWKTGTPEQILHATRPPDSTIWSAPVVIVGGGRRPSAVVHDGVLRIAYERTSVTPGMSQDIVVLRREPGGTYAEEFTTSTPRAERLDPVLHVSGSRLWLDWKHDEATFGAASWTQGAWSPVAGPSWPDPSWVGVEDVRKVVGRLVE